MAINIGNDAVKACQDLRGNPDFAKLLDALAITVRDVMYAAMKSPEEKRLRQTSVAEGMHEMTEALHMAYEGKLSSQLSRPTPPGNPKFRRNETMPEVSANV